MDRLKGKVAVITGCSSGVGAATAQKFAAEGAKVVISARRQQQLEEVADKIRAAGGEVLPVVGDISKPEDAQALIDKAVAHWDGGDDDAQAALNASATEARKRLIGSDGGWAYGGDNSTPIEAAVIAYWAAKTTKRDPDGGCVIL